MGAATKRTGWPLGPVPKDEAVLLAAACTFENLCAELGVHCLLVSPSGSSCLFRELRVVLLTRGPPGSGLATGTGLTLLPTVTCRPWGHGFLRSEAALG